MCGARKESVDACSSRLIQTIESVAEICPQLLVWKRTAARKRDARATISFEPRDVIPLLETGRNCRDSDKGVIQSLGYSFGMWNEIEPEVTAKLEGTCGLHASGMFNRICLRLPESKSNQSCLFDSDTLNELLKALVLAWEPDFGLVYSDALLQAAFPNDVPLRYGWISYARMTQNRLGKNAPEEARIEKIGQDGILIDLLKGEMPSLNEDRIRSVQNIKEYLS